MEVCTVKNWKNCLFVLPMLDKSDEDSFRHLALKIKEVNPQIAIDTLFWQPDKKKAKSKEYVRLTNELNETDFSWLGKFKNEHIRSYLNDQYDALIIFPSEFPRKVMKLLNHVNAGVSIGFKQGELSLDVVFTAERQGFTNKIDLFERYMFKSK